MKKQYLIWMILIVSSLVIFSCDEEDDSIPAVNPLTANAGEDKQTTTGSAVVLDGSASTDAEGGTFNYSWSIKSKPAGSAASLDDGSSATPGFVADKAGVFLIELIISKDQWTAKDEVKIAVSEASGPQMVEISEDIVVDLVLEDIFTEDWTKVDYLVTNVINVDARLTIKPGVKVAFAENTGLMISSTGSFVSEGGEAEGDRIYLTGETETIGFWGGLLLQSADVDNKMNYTSLSCAGANPDQNAFSAGMYLDSGSKISISHSSFTKNAGMGLFAAPGSELAGFSSNYMMGNEEDNFVIALPASEVGKIAPDCQFWNAGIAVLTADLNNGATIEWGSYNYTLLSGLEVTHGTRLKIAEQARIYVNENERIAALSGGSITAVSRDANPIVISGLGETPGYWKGIFIENSGNNPSKFQYVNIRYAGSTPLAGDQPATIHLGVNGKAAIDNTSLGLGAGDGIEATSDGATLLSFSSNVVREHQGYPLAVSTQNVAVIDEWSHFVNNGKSQVRIDGNFPIANDQETIWKGFRQTDFSYHVRGLSNDLVVWSGLKLNEGVVLEMEPGSRIVVEDANNRQGYLYAIGNDAKNIVFKAVDEVPGSWHGITFSSLNTKNYFDHVQVLHGGKTVDNSFSANIVVDNSPEGKLTILNSVVGYSGQHGISVVNDKRENLADDNISFTSIPGSTIYAW
ncbi:hypothetical protein D1164_16150 [Mariniphaga sediminis]|uniref:Right-handed parallel beta-helix repeat-containing protein n=1 Tax=Mariniphaga sediminis TaxID=1628158 RepID=A0A399D022_9BACT|nr:hypothetical protein [Mariniphaga sediminis]RIH64092.1 hypothetical protein D1164_16150 [Mariniphaga sediminis]